MNNRIDKNITAPIAKIIPKIFENNGDIRIDNYFWLRNRTDPAVMEYIKAENEYSEKVTQHTQDLQKKLYKEFLSRIKETDITVPEKIDNYYYYSRTVKGKQYKVYCRKKNSLNSKEEILLDLNNFTNKYKYLKLGIYTISIDHKLLAYSLDTDGSENYTLYIKNLETNKLLEDKIPNTYYYAEWTNDNKAIFYVVTNKSKRPYRLYKHIIGTDPKTDKLIYEEKDEAFYLSLYKTKSKKYLIMSLESMITTEQHFLKLDEQNASFQIIHPRQHEMEYYTEHHGNKFYILTNDNAKNFKLVQTPIEKPSKNNWKEIIPHNNKVKLDYINVFKNHIVVIERENGLKKARILNLTNNKVHYIKFSEPVYTFWLSANKEFNTNTLRFHYTSLVTPESVYDYDMDKKTRLLKKKYKAFGYKSILYKSERIYAKSSDGTNIPISLVYKKSLFKKDGKNPLLLYGYGAYGYSVEPGFHSEIVSLLNRGFIYAIAHIRGGGELGKFWHDQGKLLNKKNTFTDFISCAEYLVSKQYTSPDRLAINGASAGGLLVGAVANMRPDLFKIVVAEVPFVDVINTMLDSTLPLTILEYEEWGNPNNKQYYDYIKSYSPYDNVEAKNYPNILITAGLNDPRVSYWEPTKWVAKLRALKKDTNILLLKTYMGAGHFGQSGRYESLKETAFIYAFILDILNIKH